MTDEDTPDIPEWTPWVLNWLDERFGGRDKWDWDPVTKSWQGVDLTVPHAQLLAPYEAAHAYVFILTGGYVESATTASLILRHHNGFHYVEDAIESLGKVFREALDKELARHYDHGKRHRRCPHCDKPLVSQDPADAEGVAVQVYEYIVSNCDGSHALWEGLQNAGWQVGALDIEPEEFSRSVIIFEYADTIIADVAFDGRTVVERGAVGWEHRFDWASHMKLPSGIELYRPTPEITPEITPEGTIDEIGMDSAE